MFENHALRLYDWLDKDDGSLFFWILPEPTDSGTVFEIQNGLKMTQNGNVLTLSGDGEQASVTADGWTHCAISIVATDVAWSVNGVIEHEITGYAQSDEPVTFGCNHALTDPAGFNTMMSLAYSRPTTEEEALSAYNARGPANYGDLS